MPWTVSFDNARNGARTSGTEAEPVSRMPHREVPAYTYLPCTEKSRLYRALQRPWQAAAFVAREYG
ncbi:hypothetical protein NGF19_27130 [Streptomyces sp. RY43-2]|uniref:Transposase n=1 Tax=Streptomyces macrolidinus TaxID=2952607 RepID=A0ABT0ZLG0_9ACTN|nr:hypothetical protein [Streptomyces macrolidinus]MCN9244411.1 hypothetical protein [Streptomyces macrolidinus]